MSALVGYVPMTPERRMTGEVRFVVSVPAPPDAEHTADWHPVLAGGMLAPKAQALVPGTRVHVGTETGASKDLLATSIDVLGPDS